MHVLENKETGEITIFKYVTPVLNTILGYTEQYFRRLADKNDVIETEKYKVSFNCRYDGGKRGGYRVKNT